MSNVILKRPTEDDLENYKLFLIDGVLSHICHINADALKNMWFFAMGFDGPKEGDVEWDVDGRSITLSRPVSEGLFEVLDNWYWEYSDEHIARRMEAVIGAN